METHRYSLLYKDSIVEIQFFTSVILLRGKIYYIILLGQARDFITVQISIHCTDLQHFEPNRKHNHEKIRNRRIFAERLSAASLLRNLSDRPFSSQLKLSFVHAIKSKSDYITFLTNATLLENSIIFRSGGRENNNGEMS